MSRFSTQELFLTGITVVVVGFTVAVGSSSLTSLVGESYEGKSDGQSQDGSESRPPWMPVSGSTGGSGAKDSNDVPEKTEGSNRPVDSGGGSTGGSGENKNAVMPEKTDGNNQPVYSSEEEGRMLEAQRQQELIRQAEDGYRRTLQEYWDSVLKEQKIADETTRELSRGDVNKDGTIDAGDRANFEEVMRKQQEYIDAMREQRHTAPQELQKRDINKDGTVDQSDVKILEEILKQQRDVNRDNVVTTEEEYGYVRKEEVPDANEQEGAGESEVNIWTKLKETFFSGDEGEEKVDYTVEYAPDGTVESTTIYEYIEDESQESIWNKLNPLNWFGRKSDQVSTDGTEGRPVHSGASEEDSGTPKGLPFDGKPVPGKPFNEEGVSEGRPFDAIWTEEEPTESSYEDFLNDRNGVNGLNGINGMNGLNGINGVNGMNGLNGINGLNGLPEPRPSRVFLDTDQKPEVSVSDKKESGFWDTVKGLFGL